VNKEAIKVEAQEVADSLLELADRLREEREQRSERPGGGRALPPLIELVRRGARCTI